MKATIKKIVEQVEALPESELDEFLSWLAEYETGHSDEWDKEIEQDSQNGGPLSPMLKRVRADIAAGRTKPLDEISPVRNSSGALAAQALAQRVKPSRDYFKISPRCRIEGHYF